MERLERLLGLAEPVEDDGERLARLVVAGGELHHPGVRSLRRVQVAHLEVALAVFQPHRRLNREELDLMEIICNRPKFSFKCPLVE